MYEVKYFIEKSILFIVFLCILVLISYYTQNIPN